MIKKETNVKITTTIAINIIMMMSIKQNHSHTRSHLEMYKNKI